MRGIWFFLNFANATPRMQFAKVAPPGFERENRGRPIVTLFCHRALTSVATTADLWRKVMLRIHIKPIELTQNWTESDKNFQCAQPTNVG